MASFSDVVKQYGRPTLVLDKRDMERVRRASVVITEFTNMKARRFVQQRTHDTLLVQYGSDLTPLSTRETWKHAAGLLVVRRSGRAAHEFLAQRCYVTDSAGKSVLVMEPPLIVERKTAFSHFVAMRQLFPTLRELNHQGVCVQFHKFDRAIMTVVRKLVLKWHVVYTDHLHEPLSPGSAYDKWITTWVCVEACFGHDINGSLRWSILQYTKEKALLREAFLIMESFGNGAYDLLITWVGHGRFLC